VEVVAAVSRLDVLYEPDCIDIGLTLFTSKRCPRCGLKLPRNIDYFGPDAARRTGMQSECRRCRSRRSVERFLAKAAP